MSRCHGSAPVLAQLLLTLARPLRLLIYIMSYLSQPTRSKLLLSPRWHSPINPQHKHVGKQTNQKSQFINISKFMAVCERVALLFICFRKSFHKYLWVSSCGAGCADAALAGPWQDSMVSSAFPCVSLRIAPHCRTRGSGSVLLLRRLPWASTSSPC